MYGWDHQLKMNSLHNDDRPVPEMSVYIRKLSHSLKSKP